ncbi:MAG: hypothetical protein MMC33_000055 [Icmadophila ericetorum]|nr:hypothetical protein [Icmadophila ericetorum]
MHLQEVFLIFNLDRDESKEYDVADRELYNVQSERGLTFKKLCTVIRKKVSDNEALAQCFINPVIFSCLLEEHSLLQEAQDAENQASRIPSFNPQSATASLSSSSGKLVLSPSVLSTVSGSDEVLEEPARTYLGIYFETEIRQNVIFKGIENSLCGLADYSLGRRGGGITGNLIVVGAKSDAKVTGKPGLPFSFLSHNYDHGL